MSGPGTRQWPRGPGTSQAQSGMSFGTWGPGEHLSRRSARSPDLAGLTARHAALQDGTRANPSPGRASRGPQADTQENSKQTGTHGGNASSGLRNRRPRWWESRRPRDQHQETKDQIEVTEMWLQVQFRSPGVSTRPSTSGSAPTPLLPVVSRRAKVLPAGLISPGTQDSTGPASPRNGKAARQESRRYQRRGRASQHASRDFRGGPLRPGPAGTASPSLHSTFTRKKGAGMATSSSQPVPGDSQNGFYKNTHSE